METEPNNRTEEPKKIKVAVSELRGDNILDETVLAAADMVELKFFDDTGLPQKERLVHIFPYYKREGGEVVVDIADENFSENVRKMDLPAKIDEINPKWVSLHFGWGAAPAEVTAEEIEAAKREQISEDDKEILFQTTCKNIQEAKRLFGGRQVLLENLDLGHNAKHKGAVVLMVDPEFISRVLKETDSGMVLDLEHAYVSAKNLGMRYRDYLSKLPLERVREVHLSRPTALKRTKRLEQSGAVPSARDKEYDILVDVHKALVGIEGRFTNRVYVILKSLWQRMPNLEVVTLELNLPPDEMKENLGAIKEIVQKLKKEK